MYRLTYMQSFGVARTCDRHPLGQWLHRQLNRHPLRWRLHRQSAVTETSTLSIEPNSLLSFNPEENGSMKILQASYSLNRLSTIVTKTCMVLVTIVDIQESHTEEKSSQRKVRNIFFSLVLPLGQHHISVLGEGKNGWCGQTHVHVIFWSCTYTQS